MHLYAASLFGSCLCRAFADGPAADFDGSEVDGAVRPQDDLFRAANGRWLNETQIPDDKPEHGSFTRLCDLADDRVRRIAEELAASATAAPGSIEFKLGAFYRSFIDDAAIDAAGPWPLAPLQPLLAELDALRSAPELAALIGRWQGFAGLPFTVLVDADARQPGRYRAILWQGGLGLPDRDYCLKRHPHYHAARTAYLEYVQTLLRLSGDPAPAGNARRVVALERRLARAQWSSVDNRDPIRTYNPMGLSALRRAAPGLDWAALLAGAALPAGHAASIAQPSYAAALARLVSTLPLADWRLYLRVRLLDRHGTVLPRAFREAHFAFHGRALRGQLQPLPRWQQGTAALGAALGEAVGHLYVARHFPPAHKARLQGMVAHLMTAYRQSIDALPWMGTRTRRRARGKLDRYLIKIGYPEQWRDYGALDVRDGDALGNALRAGRAEHERQAARAGSPVNRAEWAMTPQTVNAYYNPGYNEIVFPAAILEPPFFDMAADDALNYGAIGAIIGHEISHGFDDQGSRFDGDGRLRNWWAGADRAAFDALGERLVAQFGRYEPIPGHRVNGRLTLGENMADLSGLQIAFKAYLLARQLDGAAAPDAASEQRFFFGWARAWRTRTREARALQLLTIDPHSPGEFRANGAAVNHDGFHRSFGTRPGDGMYKPIAERIRIW
jgi:putative endopeptidase